MKTKRRVPALRGEQPDDLAANGDGCDRILLRRYLDETENHARWAGNRGNVGSSSFGRAAGKEDAPELTRTQVGFARCDRHGHAEPRKALKTGARRRRNERGLVHGQNRKRAGASSDPGLSVQLTLLCDLARVLAIIRNEGR